VPRAWTALAHFCVDICSVRAGLGTDREKSDE